MYSVHAGLWDPRPPSKHASPVPLPPPSSRLAHVTTATPAKRITFYKSGDSQFGGVRMAVHKRSFKCFDALLDDLSQKVPLPFGVRTVTTPRGTHSIKHLEQLQDGACYLCSDRRQAKPIDMELASKRPTSWYHHSRRPQRPETSSTNGQAPYRQRRVLLVKNSEPGMRRSVVLSRRSTRSLRAFLDEVSEVMQFHVRKLYTAEGRRIDSVQNLMTCPGVLVCVGREAFSPLLINFIKRSSEEKLPGLGCRTPGNGARSPATQGARSPPHGAQSRASEYSEGHESKKNVNFGLETKKSIIHPRSDSSNRSTRFSLSSDKSYSNGLSACSRPAIMNDDIEKRVLVNKDGSLSVEMRVRFRLHSEETLQWSTQIKKSPSLTNASCPLSRAEPHYLQQGVSESCSDPDSASFDPERVDYSSRPLQRALESNYCPCCYQRPELPYDLWENPAHSLKQPPAPPPHPHTSSHTHTVMRHTHSSSSSSSCNSRRMVRCRAQLSGCRGGSASERSQVVQEEMCVTEHRVDVEQDGGAHVEVCTVSRSCSCREARAVESDLRPLSRKSVEDEMVEEEGQRPVSAVSSSSRILQTLKEDRDDDEEDELPPSASQCCRCSRPSASPTSQGPRRDKDHEERSGAVTPPSSCRCGAAPPLSAAGTASSSKSKKSRVRVKPNSEEDGAADDEDEEVRRGAGTGLSAGSSAASGVCSVCGGCKRGGSPASDGRASQRSQCSHPASLNPASPTSNRENARTGGDAEGSDDSAASTQSNNQGGLTTGHEGHEGHASSPISRISNCVTEGNENERAPSASSAASCRSKRSHRSGFNCASDVTDGQEEDGGPRAPSAHSNRSAKSSCTGAANVPNIRRTEEADGENAAERAISSLSDKSGASAKTQDSVKSLRQTSAKAAPSSENTGGKDTLAPSRLSVTSNASVKSGTAQRPSSSFSTKSAITAKSGTSRKSTCSRCTKAGPPGPKEPEQEAGTEVKQRPASVLSAKSVNSVKSCHSDKASETSLSPRCEAERHDEGRAESPMSRRSAQSRDQENVAETEEEAAEGETEQRPESKLSAKSGREEQEDAAEAVLEKEDEEGVEENGAITSRTPSVASNVSSHQSHLTGTANDIKDPGDSCGQMLSPREARSPRSHSPNASAASHRGAQQPAQQLAPGGETRVPSGLSVRSTASAQSSRSRCRRGASSAKKGDEELKTQPTSERAASVASTASRRQKRESEAAEQPLSENSLVSVGQKTSGSDSAAVKESGKCPDPTKSSDESSRIEDVEKAGAAVHHPAGVNIPTIETPAESKDKGEEAGDQVQERAASANSSKSRRSCKSSCKCSIKAAGDGLETEKEAGETKTASAGENQVAIATEDMPDDGPRCLRPESKASSQSKQRQGGSPESGHNSKSKSGSSSRSRKTGDSQKKETSIKSPSKVETCSESTLSHSLSAADLLKETMAAARPRSCQSKASKASERSPRRHRTREPGVTPACLPNASPNDVVSEWLRSIPANGGMLAPDDELNELKQDNELEDEPAEEGAQEEEAPENQRHLEEEENGRGEDEKEEESKCDAVEEDTGSAVGPGEPMGPSSTSALLLTGPSLPRNSSAAVMKVLLSSSLGRCHSMPEVSPVYGRRLSTSARGLLDCLAQLQLIEPALSPGSDPKKDSSQQYEDIMAILQSLWLTEPRVKDAKETEGGGVEQVTPPWSSSGVDMSSGSGGSGKENGNRVDDETAPKEPGSIHEDKQVEKDVAEDKEENAEKGDEENDREAEEAEQETEERGTLASGPDAGHPSSSDKSFAHDSSNERETLEDTSSGTPPTVLRAPLTKRLSQDPDPVWVLHLLKKLEKQFINHYIDAMAEFKVRWDLDDNLILNTMIKELRDEVSRRIQSSIEREMRKIQSRAGKVLRSPRPPQGRNLSRESTTTEKRRRMLKVMKNQSVKTADSLSDDDLTGEFSDQRSDDDYCPCDACVRKKMAARPLKANPLAAEAPVMMEFDLLKILQLKKSPSPADVAEPSEMESDEKNLEVVHEEEEEEETKEETKADVILEETIAEEEEAGDEEDEVGGEKEGKTEQEEVETEEDVQEDEGEAECHCHCAKNEEEGSAEDGDGETRTDTADDEEKDEEEDEAANREDGSKKEEEESKTTDGEKEDDGARTSAEEGEEEEESPEDKDGGETEEQEEETSEVEGASPTQGVSPAVCVTEGEEGDVEDSETSKNMSEREEAEPTDGEKVQEDAVEEFKPDGEEDQEVNGNSREEGSLLHQFTRTSVESQPGSMEDVHTD